MVSVKYLFAALAAVIVSTTAHTADVAAPAAASLYTSTALLQRRRMVPARRRRRRRAESCGRSIIRRRTQSFVWPASWTIHPNRACRTRRYFGARHRLRLEQLVRWMSAAKCADEDEQQLCRPLRLLRNLPPGISGTCFDNISAACRRRFSWPTPMWISAPGGA